MSPGPRSGVRRRSAAAAEGEMPVTDSLTLCRAGCARVSPVRAIPGEFPPTGYSRSRAPSGSPLEIAPRAPPSPVPADRSGRRDDGPGKAALEARSGSRRPARRAAAVGLRDRLRDERQDHDGGDGGRDPAPPPSRSRTTRRARISCPGSPRRCSPRRGPSSGCSRWTRPPCRRSRADQAARRVPRKSLPRPARPLRRARARRRALAGGRRDAPSHRHARRQRGRPPGRRARARAAPAPSRSASTIRGSRARRSSMPPTRSTASSAARRTSTRRPTSVTSATTAVPPAGTRGRRSTSSRATSSSWGSSTRRSLS